jgi:hypothetical protein
MYTPAASMPEVAGLAIRGTPPPKNSLHVHTRDALNMTGGAATQLNCHACRMKPDGGDDPKAEELAPMLAGAGRSGGDSAPSSSPLQRSYAAMTVFGYSDTQSLCVRMIQRMKSVLHRRKHETVKRLGDIR